MKIFRKSNNHIVDLLFTLSLFCIFTASSLMVVLIGANVYKSTVSGMTRNYDMRTSLTYISQKIRQNDCNGKVFIEDVDKIPVLVLEQEINNADYQTWIYFHKGFIKELFTRKGGELSLDDGREIMQVKDLKIESDKNGIYTFTATDKSGKTSCVKSFLRCSSK